MAKQQDPRPAIVPNENELFDLLSTYIIDDVCNVIQDGVEDSIVSYSVSEASIKCLFKKLLETGWKIIPPSAEKLAETEQAERKLREGSFISLEDYLAQQREAYFIQLALYLQPKRT